MGTKQQDVAVVTFSLATPSFSLEDTFSVPMVISEITDTDERTQIFTTLEAVTTAGYSSGDFFNFATSHFGQVGRKGGSPNNLMLGKKLSDANCTQTFVFDADATAGEFTITLGALTTAAIAFDANVAAVKSALESLAAITEVTVTLNTGATQAGDKEGFAVEFTGATDEKTDFDVMSCTITALTSVSTVTVTKTIFGSAVETWGTAYAAIKASNSDFYFTCPDVDATLETTLDTLTTLVEADKRQLHAVTATADAIGSATTDIGSTMLSRFARSHLYYSSDTTYSLVACELGATIPDFFGATNPSYAPLALITADTLTDSAITNLIAKKYARCESINLKSTIMGTSSGSTSAQGLLSTTGVSAKSLWIKDYLEYVVSNALMNMLQTNPNVYFSQFWFDAIENLITTTMQTKGVDQGLLVEGSIDVTMPDLATYDATKKLNEFLDGILADSEKTNSISKIQITGKIK